MKNLSEKSLRECHGGWRRRVWSWVKEVAKDLAYYIGIEGVANTDWEKAKRPPGWGKTPG